jgi:hypothetical protein
MKEHAPLYLAFMASALSAVLLWLSRATGIGYRKPLSFREYRAIVEQCDAALDRELTRILRDIHRPLG